jgi:ATP-binding cassette subfamily B protein
MGTAIGGIAVYFLALTLSHLAAFRVETQMRRIAMQRLVQLPLGFFDQTTSGRIRKIIDDNASTTHSFLAHQMPDLAGSLTMPLVSLVLIFVFDWRLGLACLVPIVAAMAIMSFQSLPAACGPWPMPIRLWSWQTAVWPKTADRMR